ncbi:CYTH domain-containing protein [Kiloniella laminariae]|uniref:CYTH domain-containing protein n=1 Tax=Kiloniella laminariae TaxID=454162 RepID=A0ABT4LKN5_9PROT|nr:CYTH and CHAD domain-containing protein [Kiloniella laminariae]MCZ4281520.1 CYTH domain-containing protein [Kiloniella laminariae]
MKAIEVEIKLLLQPEELAVFRRSPFLKDLTLGKATLHRLLTRYFDTADHALKDKKMTFRLRRESGQWVQTVKSKEADAGIVKQRAEFTAPSVTGEPDLELIEDRKLRAKLEGLLQEQPLEEICLSDVHRVIRLIQYRDSKIEMAIDTGSIRAKDQSEQISEIELELLEGCSEDMLDFVSLLQEHCTFAIGTSSKASRGFHLACHGYGLEESTADLLRDVSFKKSTSGWVVVQQGILVGIKQLLESVSRLQGAESQQAMNGVSDALSRLLVSVIVLKEMFPKQIKKKALKRDLLWLHQLSCSVGDLDYLINKRVLPLVEENAECLGLSQLISQTQERRDQALRELCVAVTSSRFIEMVVSLERLIGISEGSREGEQKISKSYGGILADRRAEILYAVPGDVALLSSDMLDAMRRDVQYLRYSTEFFQSLWQKKDKNDFRHRCLKLEKNLDLFHSRETLTQLKGSLKSLVEGTEPEVGQSDIMETETLNRGDAALSEAVSLVEKSYKETRKKDMAALDKAWRKFSTCEPFWKE